MKAKIFFLSILFHLLFLTTSYSQNMLLLKRGSNLKNYLTFKEGELMTYKTTFDNFYTTDLIKEIQEEYIIVGDNILVTSQISSIYIANKDERNQTLKNLTLLSLGAGGLLISAEAINNLIQKENFSIDPGIAIISGSLIASGFILNKIRYKKFEVKRRNKIQIKPIPQES
jgi:hypothetical protein